MPFFGLFGPPNVRRLEAKGDVKRLIKALHYKKESYIRRASAWALGRIGDTRAVEPLIATLRDQDKGVRKDVAQVLETLKWHPSEDGARAAKPLVVELKYYNKKMDPLQFEACAKAAQVLLKLLEHTGTTVTTENLHAVATLNNLVVTWDSRDRGGRGDPAGGMRRDKPARCYG